MKLDFTVPFIQVAGISDMKEAYMLIDCGVNYMGFPLRLDCNKPDMSDADVKSVISKTKGRICPILITYLYKAKDIFDLCDYLNVDIVQIIDSNLSRTIIPISVSFGFRLRGFEDYLGNVI